MTRQIQNIEFSCEDYIGSGGHCINLLQIYVAISLTPKISNVTPFLEFFSNILCSQSVIYDFTKEDMC